MGQSSTYSAVTVVLTVFSGDSGIKSVQESIGSVGEVSGVGDRTWIWVTTLNGALCGSGEISIESLPGPGEDEGIGGVVMPSTSM